MHITGCYQSAEPFVKLIGHYTHAFELITKYKQHSQCTFSFSDNVNGWSAAASGTFAARCPATLCMPSPGHAKSGIPGRDRACNLRFWRPVLYQLSYGNISCRVQESNLQRPGYEPGALPVELTWQKIEPSAGFEPAPAQSFCMVANPCS